MSKILIEGNKIIIHGHANDLETCNTLTNLCDELSTSEKFRTVKYESGYGEFERVSDNEEKKFDDPEPIKGYQVNIQSNDGATILAQNNSIDFVVVTSNGVQLKSGYTVIVTYTYAGSKLFAGLATSANATVPEYKPGDTIAITAETTLYIVENIIIPDHHRSLTELFTNIAAVIREKTGSTEPIIADAFPTAIDAIPSGGGGVETCTVTFSTNENVLVEYFYEKIFLTVFENAVKGNMTTKKTDEEIQKIAEKQEIEAKQAEAEALTKVTDEEMFDYFREHFNELGAECKTKIQQIMLSNGVDDITKLLSNHEALVEIYDLIK